jgi:two-component sensor histidine kinase
MENLIMMGAGFVICSFSFVYTIATKNHQLVYWTFSILGVNLVGFAMNFLPSVTHFGDFIWMFSAIALAFYGLPRWVAYSLLGLSIFYIGCFTFINVNEGIETLKPRDDFQKFSLFMELVAGVSSGIYIVFLMTKFSKFSEQAILKTNVELRKQNEKIKAQDEEKSTLVKEVHHRVKNNLQIISSLLRMQSHEIENEEARKHFKEAVNRVMTMALIHQKLYQGESLSDVKLKEYFEELAFDLLTVYSTDKNIKIDFNVAIDQIGLKSIVPIGLIFNELISNSLKHAFNNQTNGSVNVEFLRNEKRYTMTYFDSGSWKSEDATGFGLELIDTLTQQLEGRFDLVRNENGSTYTFYFENLDQ